MDINKFALPDLDKTVATSASIDEGLWDVEVDVVVVGGGAAGLIAAVESAEAGALTVIVESQNDIGGSSKLSGGYVALCETDLVPGGRYDLLDDLDEAHRHDSHFALSSLYVDEAANTYARLKELGVEFIATMQLAHMRRAWAHEPGGVGGGAEIISKLERAARRRKVDILPETPARMLVRNALGRVTGLVVEGPEGVRRIKAERAIILASGGFTRNLELIQQYGREGSQYFLPLTGSGSLGDGLRMAMEVGAATSYLEFGISPTVPVDPVTDKPSLANYSGAILVNKKGKRFCRESDGYVELCWAGVRQPDRLMIQVYDRKIRDSYLDSSVSATLGRSHEVFADTLAGLGDLLEAEHGVDGAMLERTVVQYNFAVESGADLEFGREFLVGTSGALERIQAAPFVASVMVPGTTHFNGGLRVNRSMQVLNCDGDPILGLYAAGEVTGGFHGAGYMSGSFLGSALIFGRIAGKNAADERRPWQELERGSFGVDSE